MRAQERTYPTALAEVRSGRKRSHWMWYVFPQIAGLGFNETSRHYAIRDTAEASAYLEHPMLGPRLIECFPELVIDLLCQGTIERGKTAVDGGVDYVNLCVDSTALATVAGDRFEYEMSVLLEARQAGSRIAEVPMADLKGTPQTVMNGTETIAPPTPARPESPPMSAPTPARPARPGRGRPREGFSPKSICAVT